MAALAADSVASLLRDGATRTATLEAFGQHESLTSRLHNILELYADGVGILHELIQNADDAGASRVASFPLAFPQVSGYDLVRPVE